MYLEKCSELYTASVVAVGLSFWAVWLRVQTPAEEALACPALDRHKAAYGTERAKPSIKFSLTAAQARLGHGISHEVGKVDASSQQRRSQQTIRRRSISIVNNNNNNESSAEQIIPQIEAINGPTKSIVQ
ncbi:hypothetical protein EVAR_29200_1 [Eumeta japonica]|uniref:Uncharacterized protein n=1 Tax=Eumeta variegata TaxID=151549 RepID=A0A4C1VBR3_EUMVA|nr:hypothetical protein EVAR_29200_1 [Eumeta japonica]